MKEDNQTKHSFSLTPAAIAFVLLDCLVAVQALLAYQDRFLTVAQMQQHGVAQGLPFVWHFGMWGDFIIISPLVAYVIGRHLFYWQLRWILASVATGFFSAGLMNLLYTLSNIPGVHVQNYHVTAAGWVHLIYMALAIAVFIQLLLFTKRVSVPLLLVVSVLLFAHVFVGTNMVLGILKLKYPLDWYPDQPLKSLFGWITIGIVALGLAWRNFARDPNA